MNRRDFLKGVLALAAATPAVSFLSRAGEAGEAGAASTVYFTPELSPEAVIWRTVVNALPAPSVTPSHSTVTAWAERARPTAAQAKRKRDCFMK